MIRGRSRSPPARILLEDVYARLTFKSGKVPSYEKCQSAADLSLAISDANFLYKQTLKYINRLTKVN